MSDKKVEYTLGLKDLFSSKIKAATTSTERLNSVVNNTQNSFTSLGSALGIGIGVGGMVAFGKSVVDSLSNYEYFSSSLRTLMMGDAGAAKALEAQLVKTAATTPFSLVEIQDATKQLMAYGFAGGEVVGNIKMLGDVASGLKIPFGDIAYLYGTLKTQGRAYQRDILQFQQRGIPVVEQLAKQFGVSKTAISQMVTEGKIGFAEVEKAFKSMTAEGGMFFNMMDSQSKTVGGQISNLGDNWEQLKVNIGKSQRGIIAGTVSFVNEMVGAFTKVFQLNNQMDEAFDKFGATKLSFWESWGDLSNKTLKKNREDIDGLNKMMEGATNQQQALSLRTQMLQSVVNLRQDLKAGFITAIEYSRMRANRLMAADQLKGKFDLLGKTGSKAESTADLTKDKNQSITSVEARQPQVFNIDINKLVEKIEITQNNINDSATAIKEAVTKALVEAVNDFQLMSSK
jgi:tape measure domain-containing protein